MLPKGLEAVLFDAGGTLVHLDYGFVADAARGRGFDLEEKALARGEVEARRRIDERTRHTGSVPGRDADRLRTYFADVLEAAAVTEPLLAGLVDTLVAEHRRWNLWRVPLPGAHETLAALRARGLRTAVVSNADGRAARVLEAVGLAVHVDLVVDSHFEGVEKPDPAIFHIALARLGVTADRAAYVGDIHAIDVVGARAAGLHAVLIDPSGSYQGADCPRVARLSELLDHPRQAR